MTACILVFPGDVLDEDAVATVRQSLPSEGIWEKTAVVLPLAAMSELGSGKGSACHHVPPLTVPRHQCPLQEQQVSLTRNVFTSVLRLHLIQANVGQQFEFSLFVRQPADRGAGFHAAGATDCGGALHPSLHQEHLEEQLPAGRSGG